MEQESFRVLNLCQRRQKSRIVASKFDRSVIAGKKSFADQVDPLGSEKEMQEVPYCVVPEKFHTHPLEGHWKFLWGGGY